MTDISDNIIATITDLKDIVMLLRNDIDDVKKEQERLKKKEMIDKCINFGLPFKVNAPVPIPRPEDISCSILSGKGKEKVIE
jgi:hypothetical protein